MSHVTMLGRRHLHHHGHRHGLSRRGPHLTPEELYGETEWAKQLLNGGAAADLIEDIRSTSPLQPRSGSDEKPVNMNTTNMIIGVGVA